LRRSCRTRDSLTASSGALAPPRLLDQAWLPPPGVRLVAEAALFEGRGPRQPALQSHVRIRRRRWCRIGRWRGFLGRFRSGRGFLLIFGQLALLALQTQLLGVVPENVFEIFRVACPLAHGLTQDPPRRIDNCRSPISVADLEPRL
jgi:hypothetical protein